MQTVVERGLPRSTTVAYASKVSPGASVNGWTTKVAPEIYH